MPRIVDHDKHRAELLAGSFALFAERGYGVVTMRGLSRSLGISTGSLYHYFDSKPAMFRQMLLARAEQDIADAEAEVPADLDADGRLTALLGWLETRIDYLRQLVLMSLDYYQLQPDDRPFLAEISRRYRGALVERLQLPAPELGPLLYSFVLGMVVHRTLDPESVDLAAHVVLLQQLGGMVSLD
jgi:AcrR family transcriptional regulator